MGLFASCGLHSAVSGVAARAGAEADPWAAYRFLMGEWTGEGSGQPGQGGRVLAPPRARGQGAGPPESHEVTPAPNRPPVVHEDLMVVYPAEGKAAPGHYFDNEGHVIHYTVQPSDDLKH